MCCCVFVPLKQHRCIPVQRRVLIQNYNRSQRRTRTIHAKLKKTVAVTSGTSHSSMYNWEINHPKGKCTHNKYPAPHTFNQLL